MSTRSLVHGTRHTTRVLIAVVSAVLVVAGIAFAPAATAAARLEVDTAKPVDSSRKGTDMSIYSSYGAAAFDDNDDRFFVIDFKADGMRVAAHWKLKDGSRQGVCMNVGHAYWFECDKDLPEHKTVLMRVGRCDGSVNNCGTLAGYRDWTSYVETSTS